MTALGEEVFLAVDVVCSLHQQHLNAGMNPILDDELGCCGNEFDIFRREIALQIQAPHGDRQTLEVGQVLCVSIGPDKISQMQVRVGQQAFHIARLHPLDEKDGVDLATLNGVNRLGRRHCDEVGVGVETAQAENVYGFGVSATAFFANGQFASAKVSELLQ